MQQTIHPLMVPRYRVMAIWPDMGDNGFYHNQVIEMQDFDSSGQWYIMTKKATLYDAFFDMYPHLFRLMPWYEDRLESEMPEYIKLNNGRVYKVVKHRIENEHCSVEGTEIGVWYPMTLPSILAEYEEYQKTLKQNQ